jgi:hypothetical protein
MGRHPIGPRRGCPKSPRLAGRSPFQGDGRERDRDCRLGKGPDRDPGLAALIGPEVVGGALSAAVVVFIVIASLLPGPAPVSSLAVPSPSDSPNGIASAPDAVPVAMEIVGRLRDRRESLLALLSASPFAAGQIADILGQMPADVSSLVAAGSRLSRDPATADVGRPLAALAGRIRGSSPDAGVLAERGARTLPLGRSGSPPLFDELAALMPRLQFLVAVADGLGRAHHPARYPARPDPRRARSARQARISWLTRASRAAWSGPGSSCSDRLQRRQ